MPTLRSQMLELLDKGFKTAMIKKKKYFNNYDHASNREKNTTKPQQRNRKYKEQPNRNLRTEK